MKVSGDIERRDRAIGALLWYGTWLASALIAAGIIMSAIAPKSLVLNGYDIVKAGVGVFILLPITRVALTMYLFLRERDYVYTVIAAMVLLIIATGIVVDFG
jgi:uncharacterized membrane protein